MKSNKYKPVIIGLLLICGLITIAAAPVIISNHARQNYNASICHILSHDMLTALNDIESGTSIASRVIATDTFVRDAITNEESSSPDRFAADISAYLTSMKNAMYANNVFLVSTNSSRCYTYEGYTKNVSPENKEDAWIYEYIDSSYEQNTYYENGTEGMIITVVNRIYDNDGNVIGVCGVESSTASFEQLFAKYKEQYGINATFMKTEMLPQLKDFSVNMTDEYINKIQENEENGTVFTDETGVYVIATFCPNYNLYFIISGVSSTNTAIQRIVMHDAIALALFWIGASLFVVNERKSKDQTIAEL